MVEPATTKDSAATARGIGVRSRTLVLVLGEADGFGGLVCEAVQRCDDLELVHKLEVGTQQSRSGGAVVVDLTDADSVMRNILWSVRAGVNIVVGVPTITRGQVQDLHRWLPRPMRTSVVIVPNFSRSDMLLAQFARYAAAHFDSVEVVHGSCSTHVDGEGLDGLERRRHHLEVRGFHNRTRVILNSHDERLTLSSCVPDTEALVPEVLRTIRRSTTLTGVHVGLSALYDDESDALRGARHRG